MTSPSSTKDTTSHSAARSPDSESGEAKDVRWFWEGLEGYLSRKQLKQTKQRKIVVEYFLKLDRHIYAEELHEALRADGHNIGLATVYRTLNLVREAGLVEQKSFNDGRSIYEISSPDEHHDHLICLDCDRVVEFEQEEIEELQKKIAEQNGFDLESHRLDLFGRCRVKDCAYKQKYLKQRSI